MRRRSALVRRVAELCAVTVACLATVAAPSVAWATTPTFVTAKTYPYPENLPGPISCGPTWCVQVVYGWLSTDETPRGFVRTSVDGGSTWTDVGTIPPPQHGPGFLTTGTLSCASRLVCLYEDGERYLRTIDGGERWQQITFSQVSMGLLGAPVACLASGACLAIGGVAASKLEWVARNAARPVVTLARGLFAQSWSALSCVGVHCVLAGHGDVATTASAGPNAVWRVSYGGPDLWSIACGSTTSCVGVALDQAATHASIFFLERTTDDGRTWSRVARLPGATSLEALHVTRLACVSGMTCIASIVQYPYRGSQVSRVWTYRTDDGGAAWTSRLVVQLPGTEFLSAASACLTRLHCIADTWSVGVPITGGSMLKTIDGVTWSPVAIPAIDEANLSLMCTTGGTCYRVDYLASATGLATQLLRSSDDGQTWQALTVPDGIQPMVIAGCQSATSCEVFGTTGIGLYDGYEGAYDGSHASTVLLTTTDGGASWTTSSVDVPDVIPELASCTSATACVAVVESASAAGSSDAIVATTNGSTWTTSTLPKGYFAAETTLDGAAGSSDALSCSTGICILGTLPVGTSTLLDVSTDGGLTWHTVATPAPKAQVQAVQCFASSCDVAYEVPDGTFGVDLKMAQTSDGGSSWTATSTMATEIEGQVGAGLSCTSLSSCTSVIGGVGSEPVTVLTTSDGGTTWTREGWASTPTSPKPKVLGAVFVAHLSCSTTACMVATQGAYNMNQPGVAQLAQMAR